MKNLFPRRGNGRFICAGVLGVENGGMNTRHIHRGPAGAGFDAEAVGDLSRAVVATTAARVWVEENFNAHGNAERVLALFKRSIGP